MATIKKEQKWCAIPDKSFYSVPDYSKIGNKAVVIAANLEDAIVKFMELGYRFM